MIKLYTSMIYYLTIVLRFINFVRIVNIRDKYSVPKMWNIQIKYLDVKSIYVEKYKNQIIYKNFLN